MKRIVCLLVIAVLALFSGCNGKSSGVTAVTTELKFTAKATDDDITRLYDVYIQKNKTAEITVRESNAEPLKIKINPNGVTLEYMELKKDIPLNAMPYGSFIDIIYSTLCDVKTEAYLKYSDKQYYIEGDTENGYSYKIFYGATGLPFCIKETKQNITINLKNVTAV